MSATLRTHDEVEGGSLTPCKRSVSLETDLSMADIENLQTEIIELRKKMALRHSEFRQITDDDVKNEESENVILPAFACKSQLDSLVITWNHSHLAEAQHVLPKVKEEPGLASDPIIITWHHGILGEDEHHGNPGEDKHHGNLGENQHMLPKVKEEPVLDSVCKTELNCPQTHFESYLCQAKLENAVKTYKNEPAPTELSLSVHDGGHQNTLHCYSDPNPTESLDSDCNGGDQHTLQTPLKTCSVRLVDCRRIHELNENTTHGDLEGEPSELSPDPRCMPSGQTRRKRRAKHMNDIKDLSLTIDVSLSRPRNAKHKKLHSKEKLYSPSYRTQVMNSSGLRPNRSVQTEEMPHRCTHCGRNFTTDFNLHRHLKLHAGEKPYQCSRCGKRFAQLFNLNAHQRVHTGEKPHQCSVCKKQFSQASKLKTHRRIHTGEKPYICHSCGKRFSDSSTYHKHQRIHTGERPYACSVCGKCFGQSAHLLKHNISHNRKTHCCSTCGTRFSKPLSLIKHTALHSGDSNTSQLSANI
ncbi:uncharacterized protein LOC143484609 [Brachyhypopomus gauderio]|uniref:uncharacterized protein LOC143484609 n=1 Tax=Brachyhypopomus gauderio TaxID=698409 RepID=UPI0040432E05